MMYMETLKSFLYFGNKEAVWGLDIVWVKVNKNEITPVRRRSIDVSKIFHVLTVIILPIHVQYNSTPSTSHTSTNP